ncbi:hypothetical protein EDC01DRAFT_717319 [Geopyxis carbonaria]|nr:hypothetical protein EDC01DRAFT_717319 [Geopyxis carbonaria]
MYTAGAGHQLDLNHLWTQVQELSAILAANRESSAGLVRRADEIRNRGENAETSDLLRAMAGAAAAGDHAEVNGDGDEEAPMSREEELVEENLNMRQDVADLRVENDDLSALVQDYETVLEKVLEGLRVYAHEHSVATINIHSSYTNQLAAERQSNAALRKKEAENEARLGNISRLLREAYQHGTMLEPNIMIEKLKAENQALREALGLEAEDSDGSGES